MHRTATLAAAALLAGCGGGGGDSATYSLGATRDCLSNAGFEIGDDPNYSLVGIEPSGGAFSADKDSLSSLSTSSGCVHQGT